MRLYTTLGVGKWRQRGMPAFPIDMQIDVTTLRWQKVGEAAGGAASPVTEKQENPKLRKDRTQHKYGHVHYLCGGKNTS